MAEDYVRPPLIAVEPSSRWWAVWRLRLVAVLIVLAVIAGVYLAIQAITSSGEQNPGINDPQGAPSVTLVG